MVDRTGIRGDSKYIIATKSQKKQYVVGNYDNPYSEGTRHIDEEFIDPNYLNDNLPFRAHYILLNSACRSMYFLGIFLGFWRGGWVWWVLGSFFGGQ